ncbi:MAG: VOC family protein [Pseudomonadota bacterium]
MQRCFTSLLVEDPDASAFFYERLLGMTRHFEDSWFIILTHPDMNGFELGLFAKDHAAVPAIARGRPTGAIVTFVVDDCDAIHDIALRMGATINEPPRDMPYGQRRMIVLDPDGAALDVSSPTAPPPS